MGSPILGQTKADVRGVTCCRDSLSLSVAAPARRNSWDHLSLEIQVLFDATAPGVSITNWQQRRTHRQQHPTLELNDNGAHLRRCRLLHNRCLHPHL